MLVANGRFLGAIVEAMWDMRGEMDNLSKAAVALRQLQERLDAARQPPGIRARCLEVFPDTRHVLVRFGSVREEVTVAPHLEMEA